MGRRLKTIWPYAKHVKRTILHMYGIFLNAIKFHCNFISDHLPEKQKFESYYSIDAPIIHKCNNNQQLFSYASVSITVNNPVLLVLLWRPWTLIKQCDLGLLLVGRWWIAFNLCLTWPYKNYHSIASWFSS
jgi:hypothetical protein